MYIIYANDEVFSTSESDEIAVIKPTISTAINRAAAFTFTVPATHPLIDSLAVEETRIRVLYTQSTIVAYEECFIGHVTSLKKAFDGSLNVSCDDFTTYLNDVILRPFSVSNQPANEVIEEIMGKYNRAVDAGKQIEDIYASNEEPITMKWNYTTVKKALDDIRKEIGGYIYPYYQSGGVTLNICTDSLDAGKRVELGINILDIVQNYETADIVTRLIPLGAKTGTQTVAGIDDRLTISAVNGGLDYIDSNFIDRYGVIEKTVIFEGTTNATKLLTKARKHLESAQYEKLAIKISAINLPYDDFVSGNTLLQTLKVGELVTVRAIGITGGKFLCSQTKMVLDNPLQNSIVLGTEAVIPLSEQTSVLNSAAEQTAMN